MLLKKHDEGFEKSFETLGLEDTIIRAVKRLKFKTPTEIQQKAIPLIMTGNQTNKNKTPTDTSLKIFQKSIILSTIHLKPSFSNLNSPSILTISIGRDVVACAKTGTGKTAAFLIPLIDRLKEHSSIVGARALIIVPTRELALQTLSSLKDFGKYTNLRNTLIVGGYGYEGQFESLASSPDIVIATPGRLMEIMEQTGFSLRKVEYLVFDEADMLFEMGFSDQIKKILKSVSQKRQTLLFSATIPRLLTDFAAAGLNDYQLLRIDSEYMMPKRALLHFFVCRSHEKLGLLALLLQRHIKGKTIVFCPTKQVVELLTDLLPYLEITTIGIFGKMDMRARRLALDQFKQEKKAALIVTDLAARGLDIPDVKNVVNYGFPQNRKMFVHRCGRTARAGRSGTAWNILDITEKNYLAEVALNLDRELVNTIPEETKGFKDDTGGQFFDPACAYYGRVASAFLTEFTEVINDAISDMESLEKQNEAAQNSMKKFTKSREKTTVDAARYLHKIDLRSPHPLFVPKNKSNQDMLDRIKDFKPQKSYMELEKVKVGAAKDDKVLSIIRSMKKKTIKSFLNKKRRDREIQEEEEEAELTKQYEARREEQRREIDLKNQSLKDKYKSKLFISHRPNEELRQKFFKQEGMTLEDLETQVMEKDGQQLFEHRKLIWDKHKRQFKKLKVNMKGKVIRDGDDKTKIKNDSLKRRFERWKKESNLGIQKEGETEMTSLTRKARTMLVKRTVNRQTKHAIMAKTDGLFKVKKKKRLKMERGGGGRGKGGSFKKRKKAGGGGRRTFM